MVTFIVVMLLILCVVAFAVYLFIKKGKVFKRWFFAFGGVVLAGIICIAVAVPVTSNKVKEQTEEFGGWYYTIVGQWWQWHPETQEELEQYDSVWGKHIKPQNEWLRKQQRLIGTGIYWDVDKATRDKIQEYGIIPYVELENGVYVLKTE